MMLIIESSSSFSVAKYHASASIACILGSVFGVSVSTVSFTMFLRIIYIYLEYQRADML